MESVGYQILNKRYQQMQKILRYACGIVFTINMYFTCFEAVNLKQTLTVYKA